MLARRWGRREFLVKMSKATAGVGALGAAGYGGYQWPFGHGQDSPPDEHPARGVRRFVTRPDLTPPKVTVARSKRSAAATASRYFFLAPKGYHGSGPGTQGPQIVDRRGDLVWFRPTPGSSHLPNNFSVQRYQGNPVLTWWEGKIRDGHGEGSAIIVDSTYRQIATVHAADGLMVDLHEFVLTDQGSALITAYRTVDADLSSVGGPTKGQIYDCRIQEIDVATGNLLYQWDSLDHIPLKESYASPPGKSPMDYFHINSIAPDTDGNLIISARNTCALYKVSRKDGRVIWRLGGKRSDFRMGTGTHFYWQHDARVQTGNRLSLFDDGSSPPKEAQSRGLLLKLDIDAMHVTLDRQYTHPAKLLADNQGSMQLLDDGAVCIGWGAQPYFSEFDKAGHMLLDGRLPPNEQSYRTYSEAWIGRPTSDPAVSVGANPARGVTVYASWNGATEVRNWQVLAGPSAASLAHVATAPRAGFESAIAVGNDGPYYAVVAVDRAGKVLGRSAPVQHQTS